MDQKPYSQLPQQPATAKFAVPSIQSSSLTSVPAGTQQLSQQTQHVLGPASLQSPPQSAGKVAPTPGYPTTPTQIVSIKPEPPSMDNTTTLTGTTISIKEEPLIKTEVIQTFIYYVWQQMLDE